MALDLLEGVGCGSQDHRCVRSARRGRRFAEANLSMSSPESSPRPALGGSAELLRRLQLRTGSGPLQVVWGLSYRLAARAATAFVRRGRPDCAVYSFGEADGPDVVYGVSDIDLAVITPRREGRPGELRGEILARWERLCRALPVAGRLIVMAVYEAPELERAIAGTPSRRYEEAVDSPTDPAAPLPPSSFAKPPDSVLRAGFGLPRESWRLLGWSRPCSPGLDREPRFEDCGMARAAALVALCVQCLPRSCRTTRCLSVREARG